MKQRSYLRPLIAGLSMAVISTASLAYSDKPQDRQAGQKCSGHSMQDRMKGQTGGMMMQMPAELVASLNLTDAQKVSLFEAQTAARGMHAGMRESMRDAHKNSRTQMAQGNFDPRAMFAQQDQRMAERQSARQSIQTQWLSFWDGLSAEQQSVVQAYLKTNTHSNKPQQQQQHRQQQQQQQHQQQQHQQHR